MNLDSHISLDWLSFTVKNGRESRLKIIQFFDYATITELDFGGMGYKQSATIGEGGRMFWHEDRLDMGIHVRLSATALASLPTTAIGMIRRVIEWGGVVTRLDIAFDDTVGRLDIPHMYQKILDGELVTRWRKVRLIRSGEVSQGEKMGDTVNLGARTSESFLRIYDKKSEMAGRGKDVSDIDTWVRVELEIKGQKAEAFSIMLASSVFSDEQTAGELCGQLLLGLVDFKEKTKTPDPNKSRRRTSTWWRQFVGTTEKRILSLPKRERTMEASKQWIEKSVASTLAMIVLSEDDEHGQSGYQFIMQAVADGEQKMSVEQLSLLSEYNEERIAKRTSGILPWHGRF